MRRSRCRTPRCSAPTDGRARVEGLLAPTSPRPATWGAPPEHAAFGGADRRCRFWAEIPYVHWNRNLMRSRKHGAERAAHARRFAMVHTAASDAIIAGFEAKYHYCAWRPRSPIPRPCGRNPDIAARFQLASADLGEPSRVPIRARLLVTAVVGSIACAPRHTPRRLDVPRRSRWRRRRWSRPSAATAACSRQRAEIGNARVWGGLHWRHALRGRRRDRRLGGCARAVAPLPADALSVFGGTGGPGSVSPWGGASGCLYDGAGAC